MRALASVALFVAVAVCLTPPGVQAQTLFERMIMPGALIEGHADLESNCKKCHSSFSKGVQRSLCLECHKKVSDDISWKTGLHGRNQSAAREDCKFCHTDHAGREADIVRLDSETFDHNFTDFQLKGRHKSAECAGCHKPKKKKRDAPSNCFACHEADDRHSGKLGKVCKACHSEKTWKETKPFDHDLTKFKLVASHRKLDCVACHAGEKYKDLPKTCVGCHQAQDVHKGKNGEDCKQCHSSEKWDVSTFDHDKDTKFPLRGSHKKSKCENCHKKNAFKVKLETSCVACHKGDDAHKGQLGTNCKQCHRETGWLKDVRFEHDITQFPLLGLHATAPCGACHTTSHFKDAPTACEACHKSDNFHKGRLGTACSKCHTPNGWAFWNFNHDQETRFQLTGSHSGLDCHACHKARVETKIELSTSCYGCHQREDIHRGSFGRSCERCHNTKNFSDVQIVR